MGLIVVHIMRFVRVVVFIASAIALLALCACHHGDSRPSQTPFEEGTRAYRAGRYEEAAASFAVAVSGLDRDEDRSRALHNLGNALACAGRSAEALDADRAALRLGDREATRTNYEIVNASRPRPSAPSTPRDARGRDRDRYRDRERERERDRDRDRDRDDRLFDAARELALPPAAARRPHPERRPADW
jgi:tetratricopeptide (TPR) repeat protein